MIDIGIDPGKKTGAAVYCRETKKILSVHTLDFVSVQRFCLDQISTINKIFIEVPNHHVHGEKSRAFNVGAELLADQLEHFGLNVVRSVPRNTKKKAEYIKKLTGFMGATNNHNRDAVMMVWGR
jgi:hypothetical protein